MRNKARKPTKK